MKKISICFIVAVIAVFSFLIVRDYKYVNQLSTETVETFITDTLTVDSLNTEEVIDSLNYVKPSDC